MSRPSTLPDVARQAVWNALWARLLAPVPDDGDLEPASHDNPDDNTDAAEEQASAA